MSYRWAIHALVVSCTLGGCAGWHDMDGAEGMSDQVGEVERELERHHHALRRAGSVAEVRAEARGHHAHMDEAALGMTGAMADMRHCSRVGQMRETTERMRDEARDHRAALEGVLDVSAAGPLCTGYVSKAREHLGSLRDAMRSEGCGQGMAFD